jgi:hypothetical protein
LRGGFFQTPIRIALWAASVRIAFGAFLVLLVRAAPEADMLVVADLPTMLLYWVLQHFGFDSSIANAHEIRFHLIAVAWWFFLGALLGVCWGMTRSKRGPIRRDEDRN